MSADVRRQVLYWEGQSKRRHPSDPIIAAFAQPKLDFVLKHIALRQSPKILDVGCGNGYFTYYLKELGSTTGIDYAEAMLRLNPCSTLVHGSAFDLPFADVTFDVSFCSNLLHHISEPLAAIHEMKRVSRRYVVLSEPNRNNPAILALGLAKGEEQESLRFTGSYLCSLAEQAELRVLACATMGFVTPNRMPRLIAMIAGKVNVPNPFGAYAVLVARCDE
jgi:ubiquinone/menaquinone biosynthesis C-methylase UbiE